jgi:hypothetical protein
MPCAIILCLLGQLSLVTDFTNSSNAVRLAPREKEDETLISGKLDFGFYGGPIIKFTEINDDFAVLVGGRGGLLINHRFFIGGGGYGLANEVPASNIWPNDNYLLELGYGGLVLEYILRSRKLIHLSFYTLIGGGGLCVYDGWYEPWDHDAFFVAEPGIDLMLNVTKSFRIGFGGSYRYVSGVSLNGLRDEDISGPSAAITFKFGRF